jgi:hypothetical protein
MDASNTRVNAWKKQQTIEEAANKLQDRPASYAQPTRTGDTRAAQVFSLIPYCLPSALSIQQGQGATQETPSTQSFQLQQLPHSSARQLELWAARFRAAGETIWRSHVRRKHLASIHRLGQTLLLAEPNIGTNRLRIVQVAFVAIPAWGDGGIG